MGRLSNSFFTADQKQAVTDAIEQAEKSTAGEIVVMVVDNSDDYREAAVAGGIMLASFLALVIALVFHHDTVWFYLPVLFVCSFPCYLLFRRLPRLCLPIVPRRRLEAAVRDRAVRAFYERGLYRTRDESGILIFLSLLERKVWILGDRGINAKIDAAGWTSFAGKVATGIAEGRAAAALLGVIGECAGLLATHFPRRSDDVNELTDHVIT